MTPQLSLSSAGERFIQGWEKYAAKPYPDVGGILTWGFGHARRGNEPVPAFISVPDAQKLFDSDVAPFVTIANRSITHVLNQAQFDAFISILYNVGPGCPGVKDGVIVLKTGQPSTLLRHINAGELDLAAAEFPKWDRVGGKEIHGLLNRRHAEAAMFQGKTS